MRVSRINIRCGSHIDQIQLVLTDGIQTVELSRHGAIGGSELNYTVPDGHRITKIEVWSEKALDALRFTTL